MCECESIVFCECVCVCVCMSACVSSLNVWHARVCAFSG